MIYLQIPRNSHTTDELRWMLGEDQNFPESLRDSTDFEPNILITCGMNQASRWWRSYKIILQLLLLFGKITRQSRLHNSKN